MFEALEPWETDKMYARPHTPLGRAEGVNGPARRAIRFFWTALP